ncbi:sensor histidine kinase [Krasilnikoviella flava]|uniref:histidine kinase n=1 Tax=Krasilnikoviella flava TaxID=526729 RepID=A0A1T5LIX1_9MICO|nr:histidine kinase [Krasilnikoviella flava]SKC75824.1 Histidine kinase [Krasilnikoviella flava]
MLDVLRRRLDALGVRTPTGRDALLGAVVAVMSVGLFVAVLQLVSSNLGETFGARASLDGMSTGATVAACVVIVGQAMALTLRRRWPMLCLALTLLGQLALAPLLPAFMSFQAPAGLMAAYSVGVYAPRRPALGAAAATAVVQVLLGYVLGGPASAAELGVPVGTQLWGGLVSALVTYLGAVLVGAYVGTRRELLAQLRARVAQAEREREALAAQAVLAERGRMARELHDVAAHHLSGIVVQAAAAERLVTGDPERAKESLRWIRGQGRETLENLRLVVGILRDTGDGDDAPSAPQPTLADVPALLDLARSTGTRVQETRRGDPYDLPPTAQLTVYRVLQESLANARRHAPGSAVDVETVYDEDELAVTVRNGPADRPAAIAPPEEAGPGHGVIGMTERAELVGGRLTARRTSGGGWLVRLTVPRPESAAPARQRAGQVAR